MISSEQLADRDPRPRVYPCSIVHEHRLPRCSWGGHRWATWPDPNPFPRFRLMVWRRKR